MIYFLLRYRSQLHMHMHIDQVLSSVYKCSNCIVEIRMSNDFGTLCIVNVGSKPLLFTFFSSFFFILYTKCSKTIARFLVLYTIRTSNDFGTLCIVNVGSKPLSFTFFSSFLHSLYKVFQNNCKVLTSVYKVFQNSYK